MNRLRRTTLAVVALASMGVMGGCRSQPSARAVAKDVVESLGLPQAEQECMLAVLDDMSKDEVEQLGDANIDASITNAQSGNADMQAFIAKLSDCRTSG